MEYNSQNKDTSSILTVKTGDGSCPLIFAHSVAGHADYALAFARATSPNQTILVLKWKEPAKDSDCRTMEDYAATLVPEICERIPDGPFVLIGHSFGGQLAYELAQQLLDHGREPALLALIDSKPDHEQRAFGRRLKTPNSTINSKCGHFYAGYVPKPYPGSVHLFQSEIPYEIKYADPTYGWGALCLNEFKYTVVPGDHFEIVSIMFVGRWASLLESSIHEALAFWRDNQRDSRIDMVQRLRREARNEEPPRMLLEAALSCKKGRLSEEIATYEKYIHKFPERGPYYVYRNLGEAYWQNGKKSKAIDSFRHGINFENNPTIGWILLGKRLNILGNQQEAEACLFKAIASCPNEATAKVSTGNFMEELGRWSEAEEWYRDALVLRPLHRWAMNGLAQILLKHGRYEEAFQLYDKLCKLPLAKDIHFIKRYLIADRAGMANAIQIFLDEAINRCAKSISYNPFMFQNRLTLAVLYKNKGLDVKALHTVKEALKIFPKTIDKAEFVAKLNKYIPQLVSRFIDRNINAIRHFRHFNLFCIIILKLSSNFIIKKVEPLD